jgi:hypothetical protein
MVGTWEYGGFASNGCSLEDFGDESGEVPTLPSKLFMVFFTVGASPSPLSLTRCGSTQLSSTKNTRQLTYQKTHK